MGVPFAGETPKFQIDATRNVLVTTPTNHVGVGVVAGVKWDNGWQYLVLRSEVGRWVDAWGWLPEPCLKPVPPAGK